MLIKDSCGLTAYGSYLISLRVYRYFTVIASVKEAYQRELLQKAEREKTTNSTLDTKIVISQP